MIPSATLYRWYESMLMAVGSFKIEPCSHYYGCACEREPRSLLDRLNRTAVEMYQAYLEAVRRETEAA